jgi:hypothetical protein
MWYIYQVPEWYFLFRLIRIFYKRAKDCNAIHTIEWIDTKTFYICSTVSLQYHKVKNLLHVFPIAAMFDRYTPKIKIKNTINLFLAHVMLIIYYQIRDDFSNKNIIILQEDMRRKFKQLLAYAAPYSYIFLEFAHIRIPHMFVSDSLKEKLALYSYCNRGGMLHFYLLMPIDNKLKTILENHNINKYTISYVTKK